MSKNLGVPLNVVCVHVQGLLLVGTWCESVLNTKVSVIVLTVVRLKVTRETGLQGVSDVGSRKTLALMTELMMSVAVGTRLTCVLPAGCLTASPLVDMGVLGGDGLTRWL